MKILIVALMAFISAQAYGTERITQEDLAESEMNLVEKISVDWSKSYSEHRLTRTCDGYFWNRILISLPADVPFDISVYKLEWVDYGDRAKPQPGGPLTLPDWKQDEQDGTRRILFNGLGNVFIILRTQSPAHKEFRIGVTGSC